MAAEESPSARPAPRATYRLQLNRDFGFDQAAALAPYLAALGVSHVYCSPYLRARPGSLHGYDIVSHTELNPELGDAEAFARMAATFRAAGLGQILDFVPNHMGVGGADNPRWLDVLEWGRNSQFAGWFDIEWEPDQPSLRDKLLVPFLGEQYGAALEAGALALKFDAEAGGFAVWAYDVHKLPIRPHDYGAILAGAHPRLERLGDAFAHLEAATPYVGRRARELQRELAEVAAGDPAAGEALARALGRYCGVAGDLDSWNRLDALIARQHWRLAHFRVAGDDINYRRFFDVNDLARIRMELPEVFDHAHERVFGWIAEGVIDGLRIDHVDGLLDPKRYCLDLRAKAPRPIYLVVEKILARHEDLREDWEVDGATGYEVAGLIGGLLIDPAGEAPLTRSYEDFTDRREAFPDIVRACKLRIMEHELASEVNALAREVAAVARSNPRTADFTRNLLQRALKEIIAAFPVYRSYVDENAAPTEADRRDIDWAVARARRLGGAIDPSVFDFLHGILTCDLIARPGSRFSAIEVIRVAMRIQQCTGPVMAKGLEDTAFYRYNRMLALNEVGGNPGEFRLSIAAFHRANQRRAQRFPQAMLATATHDTKRGEDSRARLAVLAECPQDWAQQVTIWSRLLRVGAAGSELESPPDRNDEYAFYQLLLGAWPPDLTTDDADGVAAFRQRLEGAMTKTMREAKLHTNWAAPDAAYEEATLGFVRSALDVSRRNGFLETFLAFLGPIAEAGVRNSLVQTALKLTLPGVPDFYQGAELWDLAFVDPDNRRPVDYASRIAMLDALQSAPVSPETPGALLRNWRDGRIKLFVIAQLLGLRERKARLFRDGAYAPLATSGDDADRVCAFARSEGDDVLVVAVALYPFRAREAPVADAEIGAPAEAGTSTFVNAFDGRVIEAHDGRFAARDLFRDLPVAVLSRQ